MSVVADLHVHTTRSDGDVPPAAVPHHANAANLTAIAITDHERLPPAPLPTDGDVTVIAGIEVRVATTDAGRVDLLGYGVEPTSALETEIDTLQQDRMDRARDMREALEETLDVTVPVSIRPGVGRPHLAKAVARVTDCTVDEVFERYIGRRGPCYVERSVPSFDRGLTLLQEACELVVLAHPFRYDDPRAALGLVSDLDGVECAYPYDEAPSRDVRSIVGEDAICTGGSDAHGADEIGQAGLNASEWQTLRGRLAPATG